jgi:squalene cyclase
VIVVTVVFGMAAWVASAKAKGIAEDAAFAIWDLRLSEKEAAAQIDMDLAQASRQLTGAQRLDYAKWCELDGWELAFTKRRADRSGGYSVHEDGIVATALAELTRLLDRKATAA